MNSDETLVSVVSEQADVLTLRVVGDLDMASADATLVRVVDLVTRSAYVELVLDVGGVPFCDSSGINMFLRLRRLTSQAATGLRIVNANRMLVRSVEVLGLDLLDLGEKSA